MFEIKVKPEVKDTPQKAKTPDSVLILRQIKKSGTKEMRSGLKKLEEGSLILDISRKFVDARHGKVTVNYRFDFITPEEKEKRFSYLDSKALP